MSVVKIISSATYRDLLSKQGKQLLVLITTLIFAATAIGVQRTLLTIYTKQLNQRLEIFVILAGAIALAVFGFSKAIGNLFGGSFSDRFNRSNTARFGLLILVIGNLIIARTSNLSLFLLANTVIGIGVGLLLASATIMFTDIASQDHRAKSLSLMELAVYMGTSIGSIVGGLVPISNISFAFTIISYLVLFALIASIFLKDTKKLGQNEDKNQLKIRKKNMSDLRNQWVQNVENYQVITENDLQELFQRVKQTNTQHYKKREFNNSQLFHSSFLLTFSTGIISRISDTLFILVFPLLLLNLGFSTLSIGIFTSLFTVFWAIGMVISGSLADRIGRKTPVVLGLIAEFSGLALLFLPGLNAEFPIIFLTVFISGLGRGLYYPIPSSIISDIVIPEKRGRILGIYRFVLDFGYVIGSIIMIIIIEPAIYYNLDPLPIFESAIIITMILLFLQTILIAAFLKDPKPNFKQLQLVDDHILKIKEGMYDLSVGLFELANGSRNNANQFADKAKISERKADLILENLMKNTYSGSLEAVDGVELLKFSQKMDKVLGHSLRSMRKLLMLNEKIPEEITKNLCKFAVILDLLIQEAVETINLMHVQVSLASQQSYRVNRAEIVLDEIHHTLFQTVLNCEDVESVSTIILIQTIESLEKAANTVEDAVQLIRLIAMKHNI